MSILEILCKHHGKWIEMVISFGSNPAFAEDIVQDTYIKISEMDNPLRMMYNDDEANHYYMYLALKSVYIDSVRKKKDLTREHMSFQSKPPADIDQELAFERLYVKTIAFISGIDRYSNILSQLYFKTDHSLRQLSKMSGIGTSSLYNSISGIRDMVQEELGEDYEDFLNGDYDKIT